MYQEPDGSWRGAISWTDRDGKRRRRRVRGKTAADARRRLADLRREVDSGATGTRNVTVSQYLERWLEAERSRVRPSTWRAREQHVHVHIVPELGRFRLVDLQPNDVERLTSSMMERGRAPRTASHCRVTLRKALQDAVRDGLVGRNVAALARRPYVATKEVQFYQAAEVRELLGVSEDDRLGPLITLAVTTGLRQGELLGLAWRDVNFDAKTLTVRQALARDWDGGWRLAEPKSRRARRTVHLASTALDGLAEQRARQAKERDAADAAWQDTDGLVFTDSIGRPQVNSNVSRRYRELVKQAGLRPLPFHALRHTWATTALAGGVPIQVVADALGHASITITHAYYAGHVPAQGRDAAEAVDRAIR